jgi:hypothetical protein
MLAVISGDRAEAMYICTEALVKNSICVNEVEEKVAHWTKRSIRSGARPRFAFVKHLAFHSGVFSIAYPTERTKSQQGSLGKPCRYLFLVYCSVEKLMRQ